MRVIIHQEYKKRKNSKIYIIDSVKGDNVIIRAKDGSDIEVFTENEFRLLFEENFNEKFFFSMQGHKIIKVSYKDIIEKINGLGLCDKCNDLAVINCFHGTANLIPVLNMVFCDKCFCEWEQNSKCYIEDLSYENKKTQYYLTKLGKK